MNHSDEINYVDPDTAGASSPLLVQLAAAIQQEQQAAGNPDDAINDRDKADKIRTLRVIGTEGERLRVEISTALTQSNGHGLEWKINERLRKAIQKFAQTVRVTAREGTPDQREKKRDAKRDRQAKYQH